MDAFEQCGITITERQREQFQTYFELLVEWNKKINLTSITEWQEVLWKHFIDSALPVLSNKYAVHEKVVTPRVLDVGTGAGFPGMVLAILCPDYDFILLDSLNKRVNFLKLCINELKLENVSVYHGRAEEYGRMKNFRNQFDFVVSRAVAELPLLLEYCIPFVKTGGCFISYKGKRYEEELELAKNALAVLNSKVDTIEKFDLEQLDKRYLLFIRNEQITDIKYPRKPGIPKKKPL